jgi:hypothetical protein
MTVGALHVRQRVGRAERETEPDVAARIAVWGVVEDE